MWLLSNIGIRAGGNWSRFWYRNAFTSNLNNFIISTYCAERMSRVVPQTMNAREKIALRDRSKQMEVLWSYLFGCFDISVGGCRYQNKQCMLLLTWTTLLSPHHASTIETIYRNGIITSTLNKLKKESDCERKHNVTVTSFLSGKLWIYSFQINTNSVEFCTFCFERRCYFIISSQWPTV